MSRTNSFDAQPKLARSPRRRPRNGRRTPVAGLDHRQILAALRALKRGDLTVRMRDDLIGIDGQIAETFNDLVAMVKMIRDEAAVVSTAVGKDGQAQRRMRRMAAAGGWTDYISSVNSVIEDLTEHANDMARVVSAVARGDLEQTMDTGENGHARRGDYLRHARIVNGMVARLAQFGNEVIRVAQEVGGEGKLGAQARLHGVSGVWKDLTESVNLMASNLTSQVREIARVTTAVAQGDLTKTITIDVEGEILQLKVTINTMVQQLRAFANEVTRVAREVGTDGKLGGQATVRDVSGVWRELTESVNSMANNLTLQVRNIAEVTSAVASGELGKKITVAAKGEILSLKNTINTMVDQLSAFAAEVTRVSREVGTDGNLGGQAQVLDVSGVWRELTQNVNSMASNLTTQVRNIAEVVTAIAGGDLSRKIAVDARGEILALKNTINATVDKLNRFAAEVTRVARLVGTEGQLGVTANVDDVSGVWKELTDNVNQMAKNLTNQVRDIAEVTTAVAHGDLSRKITVEARGELVTLKNTMNAMVDSLGAFASEVTRMAREVGTDGRLGGQADVPNAAGVWRDLTNNVNELAGNLTGQVRAIRDVATAVTEGDLTRSITVEARGEIAQLKDTVNQMIRTLAETTKVNQEQDWLKTNVARFTRMLQGQRDLLTVARHILSELAPLVNAHHGAFYMAELDDEGPLLKLFASYAYVERKTVSSSWRFGEGLIGQAALEGKRIVLANAPAEYIQISSALGEASPHAIVVVPVLFEGEVKGVIELASFERFSGIQLAFLDQMLESLGIVIATIEATMRTDELLRQSQSLTEELRSQQEELQQTNEELEEKAIQLTEQKAEVERKNKQVELARQELEEKAEQLALTSKYKSQFLANMSHELRTPLNSLLILSRQLSENAEGNLSDKQIRYADTIRQAGTDLMTLINEILDLAKIESGTMAVEIAPVRFGNLRDYVDQTFRQVAHEKGLQLAVELDEQLPPRIDTDDMRLRQVLRNLLSNAIKFTERGHVGLRIERAGTDVIAFVVSDTGIGISSDKQRLIFEAFQQADGSTSRKYGGTGLGLAISREIAGLLGGDLSVESEVGRGSAFTLTLPTTYKPGVPVAHVPALVVEPPSGEVEIAAPTIPDDADQLEPGDRVLLVIEPDATCATTLIELARASGFKVVVSTTGVHGLERARGGRLDAVVLDLGLPDLDGWVLLDRLKHDPVTRHIPVHVLSDGDDERRACGAGAVGVVARSADPDRLRAALVGLHELAERNVKQLLIVEDDPVQRQAIVELIGSGDVVVTAVAAGEAALEALASTRYDCMVVDLRLPGMSGFELLDCIASDDRHRLPPVVVYANHALTSDDRRRLSALRETVTLKDVATMDRLLAETTLFLHRVEAELPDRKQRVLRRLAKSDPDLAEHCVLIVDDDLRNIFALTSLLEGHKMRVLYAEDGRRALAKLDDNDDIDVVLMDIMMPDMDGYGALREIRARGGDRWRTLPVIALTAKAMKGDREKCLEAGASDYIPKPIDADQLLSLLRVRLYAQ